MKGRKQQKKKSYSHRKKHIKKIVDSIFTLIYAHFNAMMLQILHDSMAGSSSTTRQLWLQLCLPYGTAREKYKFLTFTFKQTCNRHTHTHTLTELLTYAYMCVFVVLLHVKFLFELVNFMLKCFSFFLSSNICFLVFFFDFLNLPLKNPSFVVVFIIDFICSLIIVIMMFACLFVCCNHHHWLSSIVASSSSPKKKNNFK